MIEEENSEREVWEMIWEENVMLGIYRDNLDGQTVPKLAKKPSKEPNVYWQIATFTDRVND